MAELEAKGKDQAMNRKFFLLNCGLLTVAIWALVTTWRAKPHRVAEQHSGVSSGARSVSIVQSAGTAPQARFDWHSVESGDYRTYIKNLRAVGCPEQTVRDIIIADVNALFDSKERESAPITNRFEYWKLGGVLARDWMKAKLTERHGRLETERVGVLRDLLGTDVPVEQRPAKISDGEVRLALLDFVPAETRSAALKVVTEMDSKFESEFLPLMGERWNAENRQAYGRFYQLRDTNLLQVLGVEGKEEYDLRTSRLADTLRFTFRGIDLNEAEFRQLFRFSKQYEMSLDPWYSDSTIGGELEVVVAAQRAVWNQARGLIGDQRLEARAPDPFRQRLGFK